MVRGGMGMKVVWMEMELTGVLLEIWRRMRELTRKHGGYVLSWDNC